MLSDLTETRLKIHGDPTMMQKSVEHATKLKAELAKLKKERQAKPGFEVISSEDPASGKKGETMRIITKAKKKDTVTPIV